MIKKTIYLKDKPCLTSDGLSNTINYMETTWWLFGVMPIYIKEDYVG